MFIMFTEKLNIKGKAIVLQSWWTRDNLKNKQV